MRETEHCKGKSLQLDTLTTEMGGESLRFQYITGAVSFVC